jgi:hypothetical protein
VACTLNSIKNLLGSCEVKLPGAEFATVDITKLREYCLNQSHPRGRHKARLFAAALNLTNPMRSSCAMSCSVPLAKLMPPRALPTSMGSGIFSTSNLPEMIVGHSSALHGSSGAARHFRG